MAEPPDWMTDSQQDSWRYAVEHAPAGILKHIDSGVLSVWVVAEDDHRRATMAQARLDASSALPMLTKDKSGLPQVSPYQYIKKNTAMLMIKSASELGFSPAARPRLSVVGEESNEESPWDVFDKPLELIPGGRA